MNFVSRTEACVLLVALAQLASVRDSWQTSSNVPFKTSFVSSSDYSVRRNGALSPMQLANIEAQHQQDALMLSGTNLEPNLDLALLDEHRLVVGSNGGTQRARDLGYYGREATGAGGQPMETDGGKRLAYSQSSADEMHSSHYSNVDDLVAAPSAETASAGVESNEAGATRRQQEAGAGAATLVVAKSGEEVNKATEETEVSSTAQSQNVTLTTMTTTTTTTTQPPPPPTTTTSTTTTTTSTTTTTTSAPTTTTGVPTTTVSAPTSTSTRATTTSTTSAPTTATPASKTANETGAPTAQPEQPTGTSSTQIPVSSEPMPNTTSMARPEESSAAFQASRQQEPSEASPVQASSRRSGETANASRPADTRGVERQEQSINVITISNSQATTTTSPPESTSSKERQGKRAQQQQQQPRQEATVRQLDERIVRGEEQPLESPAFASNRSRTSSSPMARINGCLFGDPNCGRYLVTAVPVLDSWSSAANLTGANQTRLVNEFVFLPEDSALTFEESGYSTRRPGKDTEPLAAEHRTVDGDSDSATTSDDVELDYINSEVDSFKSVQETPLVKGRVSSSSSTRPDEERNEPEWLAGTTTASLVHGSRLAESQRVSQATTQKTAHELSAQPVSSSTQISTVASSRVAAESSTAASLAPPTSSSTNWPPTRITQSSSFTVRVSPETKTSRAPATVIVTPSEPVGTPMVPTTTTTKRPAPTSQVAGARLNQKLLRLSEPSGQTGAWRPTNATNSSTTLAAGSSSRPPSQEQTAAPRRNKSSNEHRQFFNEPAGDTLRRQHRQQQQSSRSTQGLANAYSPISNGADDEETKILTRYTVPSQLARLSAPQQTAGGRSTAAGGLSRSSASSTARPPATSSLSQVTTLRQRTNKISDQTQADQSRLQTDERAVTSAPARQPLVSQRLQAATLAPAPAAAASVSGVRLALPPARHSPADLSQAKVVATRQTSSGQRVDQASSQLELARSTAAPIDGRFMSTPSTGEPSNNVKPASSDLRGPAATTMATHKATETTRPAASTRMSSAIGSQRTVETDSRRPEIGKKTDGARSSDGESDRRQVGQREEALTLIASSAELPVTNESVVGAPEMAPAVTETVATDSPSSSVTPAVGVSSESTTDSKLATRSHRSTAAPAHVDQQQTAAPKRQSSEASTIAPSTSLSAKIRGSASSRPGKSEPGQAMVPRRRLAADEVDEYEGSVEDQLAKDALHTSRSSSRGSNGTRRTNAYGKPAVRQTASRRTDSTGKSNTNGDQDLTGKWQPNPDEGTNNADESVPGSLLPGRPGVDYPVHWQVPKTSFDCRNYEQSGFYADVESDCQAYHSCHKGRGGRHTFLCPNGTLFSQELLTCDWWYNVECSASKLYLANEGANNLDRSVGSEGGR